MGTAVSRQLSRPREPSQKLSRGGAPRSLSRERHADAMSWLVDENELLRARVLRLQEQLESDCMQIGRTDDVMYTAMLGARW